MVTRDIATGLSTQTTTLGRLLRVGKEESAKLATLAIVGASVVVGVGYIIKDAPRLYSTYKMFKRNEQIEDSPYQ